MIGTRFLAVDWGTTNRRVYLIDAGKVVRTERDECGVIAIPKGGYADQAAAIRERFGDLPMLLAGMVGSNVGWQAVPYVAVPAGLDDLAARLTWIDARTALVPGLSFLEGDHADVMRGEEVQLFGAVAAGLAAPDALLCQPGTHCKWVEMSKGRITRFTTAMTGELFSLLRQHSLLASQLGHAVEVNQAFRDGIRAGARRDLTASLFGVRAAGLLGRRDDVDAASFASGLLIGADVAARLQSDPRQVHVLADPALGALYAAAIEANGSRAAIVDSHTAFAAGITHIARLL